MSSYSLLEKEELLPSQRLVRRGERVRNEMLEYIENYIRSTGMAPSLEDIGRAVGLSSLNSIRGHILRLTEEGLLERTPSVGRSMRLTAKGKRHLKKRREAAVDARSRADEQPHATEQEVAAADTEAESVLAAVGQLRSQLTYDVDVLADGEGPMFVLKPLKGEPIVLQPGEEYEWRLRLKVPAL